MATQEQLRDLALSWARGRLEDPEQVDLIEMAAAEDLLLSREDLVEIEQLIGRLWVSHPDAVTPVKAYRTDISGRAPFTKGHMTLGTARAAVGFDWFPDGGVRGGTIYELVSGSWKVVHHIKRGTRPEDLPWRKK